VSAAGPSPVVLVGGSGFVGAAAARELTAAGREVTIVDRRPPSLGAGAAGVRWLQRDLLGDDEELPEGEVVLLQGNGNPRVRWPWTLALDAPLATARLLERLQGRAVTLVSSVEVYGSASGTLGEDTEPELPLDDAALAAWCEEGRRLARRPCLPWRVADHCRALAEADPSGRWVYGMSKRAQELLLRAHLEPGQLTVLRLANTFGVGQERVITLFARAAMRGRPLVVTEGVERSFLAVEDVGRALHADLPPATYNLGHPPVPLLRVAETVRDLLGADVPITTRPRPGSDSSGAVTAEALREAGFCLTPLREGIADFLGRFQEETVPVFSPPLPVVVPPRSPRPDVLADRQQQVLWSGIVKHGNRWTRALETEMRECLELPDDATLLLTTSGTEALRLAVAGTVGPAPALGAKALMPSFTFPATAEALVQLGYMVRFVDVDEGSWNLDPAALEAALGEEPEARVVVAVDTFGNPCDYEALNEVCGRFDVTLVGDSAAGLGSRRAGRPLATQAAAHAFSMSFAKVVSAAGAGGAVAFRERPRWAEEAGWTRSALIDELHAVAALEQLEMLEELVERRQGAARLYEEAIAGTPGVALQRVAAGDRHSRVHWVMRAAGAEHAERLRNRLADLGVGTGDYFRALHLRSQGPSPELLPVTERLHDGAVALPMSSELTAEQAQGVAAACAEALAAFPAAEGRAIAPAGEG
jgi:dTDP-4-amino-4,6-dideoxygalactose transaminase/nucleoside-diphosphate-sugar epimerase